MVNRRGDNGCPLGYIRGRHGAKEILNRPVSDVSGCPIVSHICFVCEADIGLILEILSYRGKIDFRFNAILA